MKHVSLIVFVTFLAASSAAGQARAGRAQPPRVSTEQQVRQFEREFIEARRQARRGNTAPLERLLSADFIATSLNGRVLSRAQFIRGSRNPNLRFTSFNLDEPQVRVYGNSAVAMGRITVTSRTDEGTRTFRFRYTNLYVGAGGRWQVGALHLTPVAAQ